MKRILITSSDAMMYQFLLKHALNLLDKGYEVDLAAFPAEGYEGQNYLERLEQALPEGSRLFRVNTARSPLSPANIKGFKQLKEIIDNGNYDLVWTNEPVMGVLTRLAASKHRKRGTRVMYISHGFHFYKGAPLKNWLIFYTIEWIFAHITDTVVTINQDDFALAKKKIPCRDIRYIRGIGFDTDRFASATADRAEKRAELGVPENAFMLLSVGELNQNKNHIVAINALASLKNDDIYYVICGEGDLKQSHKNAARALGIENNVILTGFREDIAEICHISDAYCFPSIREGLSVSMLESMSCGLPAVCSNIRGNRDLIENENGGFLCTPTSKDEFARAISALYNSADLRQKFGTKNIATVRLYDCNSAKKAIEEIIKE